MSSKYYISLLQNREVQERTKLFQHYLKKIVHFWLLILFLFGCKNEASKNDVIMNSEKDLLSMIVIDFSFSRGLGKSQLICYLGYDFIVLRESKICCYTPSFIASNRLYVELEQINLDKTESDEILNYINFEFEDNDFCNNDGGYEDGFFVEFVFLYKDRKPMSVLLKNFLTENHKSLLLLILNNIINHTNNKNNKEYFESVLKIIENMRVSF